MRVELVQRCPGVPAGLDEALDRTGQGFCERCGETVVDLTRGVVPVGRVIRCARVLVVATAVAGCGGSPAKPVEQVVVPAAVAEEKDGGAAADGSAETEPNYVFTKDPLAERMSWSGRVEVGEDPWGTKRDGGR